MSIASEIQNLLSTLPLSIAENIRKDSIDKLVEIVVDYGRPAEARFFDHTVRMPDVIVTREDIDIVVKNIGTFGSDNRAGIEKTLHRISCIRNRSDEIIGLTCRVGRAMEGTIHIIDDIVRTGKSILVLGKPGIGKTTKLREIARTLADEVGKRVVIVDTSNEIAGDGDIPHPSIGTARRMQVKQPEFQHRVMIEAVENHMPEVIVIDEISTAEEAWAARTIAERGVQLIATAHGQTLENLMLNPSLSDLIGGIQAVTLSDEEAKKRGTQKTVLERKAPPAFEILIELIDFNHLAIHKDVQKAVDQMLRGAMPRPQVREGTEDGAYQITQEEKTTPEPSHFSTAEESIIEQNESSYSKTGALQPRKVKEVSLKPETVSPHLLRVYPFGIARSRLEKAIREKNAPVYICNTLDQADAVIILRSVYQSRPSKIVALSPSIPVVVINSNSYRQVNDALLQLLHRPVIEHEIESTAIKEVTVGIEKVIETQKPVDLAPQDARIRKIQHQFVETKKFASESVGEEPFRHIRILPIHLS
jgi:stage III sporulation protein SpoIIIAA